MTEEERNVLDKVASELWDMANELNMFSKATPEAESSMTLKGLSARARDASDWVKGLSRAAYWVSQNED